MRSIDCCSLTFVSILFLYTNAVANAQEIEDSVSPKVSAAQATLKFSTKDKMLELKQELRKKWPKNRTVRFVFHGHSVPAGYFKTPEVRRFDAYPSLFHQQLCEHYSTATIDCCVTAIGGENSVAGARRFSNDVLNLNPDVVFIDYALNDRSIGLEKARKAWQSMISKCQERGVLVILMTPTPDSSENIADANSLLSQHSKQLRELSAEFEVPLVDSFAAFQKLVAEGKNVKDFLSQANHPNRPGHEVVANAISKLFVTTR
jgi:lysophospholipase L1-like esterase